MGDCLQAGSLYHLGM